MFLIEVVTMELPAVDDIFQGLSEQNVLQATKYNYMIHVKVLTSLLINNAALKIGQSNTVGPVNL